jgi:hypothetical protein
MTRSSYRQRPTFGEGLCDASSGSTVVGASYFTIYDRCGLFVGKIVADLLTAVRRHLLDLEYRTQPNVGRVNACGLSPQIRLSHQGDVLIDGGR